MTSEECKQCYNLDYQSLSKARNGQESFRLFSTNLSRDCGYCDLLRRTVDYFAQIPSGWQQKTGTTAILGITLREANAVHVRIMVMPAMYSGDEIGDEVQAFYLYLWKDVMHFTKPFDPVHPFTRSSQSDSSACFAFIERQFNECHSSHQRCPQPSVSPLPNRVLRIGSQGSDSIYLFESKGQYGRYAALSHCWGRHLPICTTTANLPSLTKVVYWQTLSRVFKDAITVCRRLNVHYIWIDSLCILQDDERDWDSESSKMRQYYENAYITISAAASTDGTQPFLLSRDSRDLPKTFELVLSNSITVNVVARPDSHPRWHNRENFEDLGPIASRAWTLQEALLSPRVLHFTRQELMWECRSQTIAEDGVVPLDTHSLRLPQHLPHSKATSDLHKVWRDIVARYSVRHLTYESDRLPALSGVAMKFQSMLHCRYYAGLWQDTLFTDICCLVLRSEYSTGLGPCGYVAPSWTWASVMHSGYGLVEDSFMPLAVIEDVQCQLRGMNRFGQVLSGCLTMRALLSPCELSSGGGTEPMPYLLNKGDQGTHHFYPDCLLKKSIEGVARALHGETAASFSQQVTCLLLGSRKGEVQSSNDSVEQQDRNADLAVSTEDDHSHDNFVPAYPDLISTSSEWEDLLVMVLGNNGNGTYSRLGLATLRHAEYFEDAVEARVNII